MMRVPLYAICLLAFFACSSRPENVQQTDALPEIFPDYVGVTVPAEIAPLDFCMADEAFTAVDVEVRGRKGGSLHANGSYAGFDIDAWHALLAANRGSEIEVTVCAEKDGRWLRFKPFPISVSRHPLGEWGVTYRRVAPGYALFGLMGLYQRDLGSFEETPILQSSQIPGQCLNCHTSNRTNPDQYVFHVRGEHGATVIGRNGKAELLNARNEYLGGSMVYPYWHPGGRFLAFSTNKTLQMFHTARHRRIEVYDASSDVFVYDTETHEVLRDSLIMQKDWAENTPAFSPDGQWLYFITSRQQDYPDGFDKQKYSLCRVAFDASKPGYGTAVDTLVSTAQTGKSVSWPRPSYDGRFLMYTQADYGYFTVWHPEADLWLLDLRTGQTRPVSEVNSPRAESLHNWSTNSRWFLFTSRRDDGLYTKLYFSSMDEQGRATKPFLLPQRNPRQYYARLLYSYNTPDFASRPLELDARQMGTRIERDERVPTK